MSNYQSILDRIGIVVIGRNEGTRLIKCLYSLLKAKVPVVYVDSQSSDNSVAEAEALNVITIILDSSKPLNAARARNEGFTKLIQDYPDIQYVHFIDADCELTDNWLSYAIAALDKQEQTAVVCGRLHEKYRNQSIYMRLCDMDWYRKPGLIDACGGIATYRRNVFEQLNGFNETLIAGEEPDLCRRIREHGWNIWCLAENMGTHDSAMVHFSQWWVRTVRCGYAYALANELGDANKQLTSICFWGGFFPLLIIASLIPTNNYGLLAFFAYPLQILKIFLKYNVKFDLSRYDRILYAVFCMLAKFPQFMGLLSFYGNKWRGNNSSIIEYK